MSEIVYTVGHSTHPVERFVELLQHREITAVADVRSRPYSRINPQFNREALKQRLRQAKIAYVFLGKELGARSENSSCYVDGRVQYDLLAATDTFKLGIRRITEGAPKHRIALMCAEKDPLHCHRTILVARHLIKEGVEIRHILADGSIEAHAASMRRLAKSVGLKPDDMFAAEDEINDIAYRIQGQAIAYQEDPDIDKSSRGEAS